MRSRADKKVTMKHTRHTAAKRPMVQSQPWRSSPPPNFDTSGRVKPCTTNWAMVLPTNRMLVMLVRSRMSPVITPPNDE